MPADTDGAHFVSSISILRNSFLNANVVCSKPVRDSVYDPTKQNTERRTRLLEVPPYDIVDLVAVHHDVQLVQKVKRLWMKEDGILED